MKSTFKALTLAAVLFVSASLSSCTALQGPIFGGISIHYVGETSATNAALETYYDEQDVKRPYRVMGRMTNDIVLQYDVEHIQEKMQEKAKQVGADAIVFTDLAPARVKDELDKIIVKAIVIKYL